MKFKSASTSAIYKKVAVYGGPGQGKTIIALSAPGKKLIIDTEGGSLAYSSLTPFEVLHTQSFGEIKATIDELSVNPPTEETTLIIDSASIIWSGLQQAMLEKLLGEKGIRAMDGTEKVQFSMASWGILKRWHKDIVNTLMSLKCHVVCTFRENELRDEVTFKPTGVYVAEFEKGTPYIFDYMGRIHDRKFKFTKGRLAHQGKLIDLIGKTVDVPKIESGSDLTKIWDAMFPIQEKATEAHPRTNGDAPEILNKDTESLSLSRKIRSHYLPKYGINNDDFELYCSNKILKDGVTRLAVPGEDGKVHLSEVKPDMLKWLIDVLESESSRGSLIKRIEELKK